MGEKMKSTTVPVKSESIPKGEKKSDPIMVTSKPATLEITGRIWQKVADYLPVLLMLIVVLLMTVGSFLLFNEK